MSKHDEFEEIYAAYKVNLRDSNQTYYEEYEDAWRGFKAMVDSARTTQCPEYDQGKMRELFETSKAQMSEAWQKRDDRQDALNRELERNCQSIGVHFR